jgi:hypothetical protein
MAPLCVLPPRTPSSRKAVTVTEQVCSATVTASSIAFPRHPAARLETQLHRPAQQPAAGESSYRQFPLRPEGRLLNFKSQRQAPHHTTRRPGVSLNAALADVTTDGHGSYRRGWRKRAGTDAPHQPGRPSPFPAIKAVVRRKHENGKGEGR